MRVGPIIAIAGVVVALAFIFWPAPQPLKSATKQNPKTKPPSIEMRNGIPQYLSTQRTLDQYAQLQASGRIGEPFPGSYPRCAAGSNHTGMIPTHGQFVQWF